MDAHIFRACSQEILIRPIEPTDSLEELTDLLHRAYKFLADLGFRFTATHQSVAVTADRIKDGTCLVAVQDGKLVGTITYYNSARKGGTPWYERSDVAYFGQFAVEPTLQKIGLGGYLITLVEELAKRDNMRELALDTAEGATHLIAYYNKRGYRFIDYHSWGTTNYRSVILSKTLA